MFIVVRSCCGRVEEAIAAMFERIGLVGRGTVCAGVDNDDEGEEVPCRLGFKRICYEEGDLPDPFSLLHGTGGIICFDDAYKLHPLPSAAA